MQRAMRMLRNMLRSPSLPYVLPFAVFIALLAGLPLLGLPPRIELLLWILIVGAVLLIFSPDAIDLGIGNFFGSVAVGVAVFVLWIAPDLLEPAYLRDKVALTLDEQKAGRG